MAWTPEKLKKLQDRFDGENSQQVYDEHGAYISSLLFDPGGTRRTAPYAGAMTFLDAPTGDLEPETLQDLDVAIIGMPMDLAVTNRPGSRFGPRALRAIERIGPYNEGLRCAPVQEMKVADVGDVPFRSRYSLSQRHEEITEAVAKIVAAGTMPLSVGGDHSISLPVLRALAKDGPVGMVHIDAHADTGGPFDGERFHHGGPFRNAGLEGLLDPERTIQSGIRGQSGYLWEFSHESGMTVIEAQTLAHQGLDAVIAKTLEVIGSGPTYVSFDIDSLDPAFAPGTGTPEVGGLTPREVIALLRGLKGMNIVGGDVVEVAPSFDATSNTAHNAATVLFEILSLMMFRDQGADR
jgi:agmatinase